MKSNIMRKLIFFESIPSTNDYAKNNFDKLQNKTIIIAKEQTAGRGRFSRKWYSPAEKSLYMSLVLKENIWRVELPIFNLISSLSVLKTIKSLTNLSPILKYPNDVYINKKKVAGILIETIFKLNTLEGIIIGIGVNINNENFPQELERKATSIFLETGKELDHLFFLKKFLEIFFNCLNKRINNQTIIEEWQRYSPSLFNTPIIITVDGKPMKAITNGLNDNGYLLVKKNDGNQIIISTNDYFFPE
jgi:BirA family biotin operon repressor/biotin-[acetyl-CoA-carboxylase] ligase